MTSRWLLIACFALTVESIPAQDNPSTAAPEIDVQKVDLPANGDQPDSEITPEVRPKIDPDKKRKATILMAAVGGIAIFGVGAIASTMLMAKHLRRVARDPGPVQKTAGNDFWFLKPPKPIVSDLDVSESHRPIHPPPPDVESKEEE